MRRVVYKYRVPGPFFVPVSASKGPPAIVAALTEHFRTRPLKLTPGSLSQARKHLGLSLLEMAHLLGYEGEHARSQAHHLETGRRESRPAQRRLIEAYLDGYRPEDWPTNGDDKCTG